MAAKTFHDAAFPHAPFKQFADFQFEGELCDVVLCVEWMEIPVHRVVMAALSPYFRAMFTGKLVESTRTRIVLNDIDPFALKCLVGFGYSGTLEILEESVQALMSAATLLQIASVRDACCDFLCDQLDASNCLGIRALGDSLSCEKLYNVAHKFSIENFTDVLQCEEFLLQPFDSLSTLLESDFLNVSSEEDVLVGVVQWLKYLPTKRHESAFQLVKRTNLMRTEAAFLADKLLKEPIIKSDEKCVQLITEAIDALKSPSVLAYWEIAPDVRKTDGRHNKEVLLAIGGECAGSTLDHCECYTLQQGEWNREIETKESNDISMIAPMQQSRTYAAVVASGRHVYAIGGGCSWKILDVVERYEWPGNEWVQLSPLCVPRLGASAVVINGEVLVLGGCGRAGYLPSVEAYDPLIDKWRLCEPMRARRSYLGVEALGGLVYSVGGFGGLEEYPDGWLDTVECTDLASGGHWISAAPMSQPRAYMGLVACEESLFALGGYNSKWLNTAERFDPREGRWHSIQSMKSPRSSFGASAMGNCLYVAGGFDGIRNVNSVECYDVRAGKWRKVAPMTATRYGMSLATVHVHQRK